jgi:hypothetical protein
MTEPSSGSKSRKDQSASAASLTPEAPPMTVQTVQTVSPPQPGVMVVEKTKKKGKKRYTKGLRDVQRLERGASKATRRLARAVEEGVATYHRRSNKSGRKKRDGAIRDVFDNLSIAAGDALQVASRAPRDLARGLNTKSAWKQVRPLAQLVAMPFFTK